ncbi:hypothetical protein BGX27_001732 [Mortierella sp. AM989]|nr:hypothetical protein BGX27_001732 [Mortierella sp. AM989]
MAPSSTTSPIASGILASSQSDSTVSLTSSSSTAHQHHQQQQHQRPELAFSTAAGLHLSLHGIIEFLAQLVKALERYLLSNNGSSYNSIPGGNSSSNSGAGPRRASQTSSTGSKLATSTSATAATSTSTSASGQVLSTELVQLNVGIVYEILDECMVRTRIPDDAKFSSAGPLGFRRCKNLLTSHMASSCWP